MNGYAFFGAIGAAVLSMWGILRWTEARQAREDERRFQAFQAHLRTLHGPSCPNRGRGGSE
jgi:hypothetical protein